MEPNVVLCVPEDHGGMQLFASTQAPAGSQAVVADVLGVPHNRVTCTVRMWPATSLGL